MAYLDQMARVVSDPMAGRQTPLLGCDGHLPTGQLLPPVC